MQYTLFMVKATYSRVCGEWQSKDFEKPNRDLTEEKADLPFPYKIGRSAH